MNNISDETLMAYADDELPASQRRSVTEALERDPSLVLRLERFVTTGRSLGGAFNEVLTTPRYLIDAIDRAHKPVVVQHRFRAAPSNPGRTTMEWLAEKLGIPGWSLAAVPALTIGLVCGGVAMLLTRSSDEAMLREGGSVATASLQRALEQQASGKPGQLATVTPLNTFRSKSDAWCRQYELSHGTAQRYEGVACLERDGRWHIHKQVAAVTRAPSSGGTYAPAEGVGSPEVEAVVDDLIKGMPLGREEEVARLREGFRARR